MAILPADQLVTEMELAILFLDIRDFTGLLQHGSEKENIQTIKKLLDLFVKIITNFGGNIINRAGDGLYAVFGLDTTLRTAAKQALRSTKMLFESLEFVNQEFALSKFGFPLEVGIGLHTGKVIVEHEYSEDMPLSVMGLPVNIAARLQAHTKKVDNDLILSDAFYSQLAVVEHEKLGKNKKQVAIPGVRALQTIWLAGRSYHKVCNNYTLGITLDHHMAIAG
ncbi:hypothetical protein GCM10023149_24900 [Mucilaginibacter gynuensis]|uniref:Guanylate cyclase domain-containing protein n=1 Tax=Mucilaginibacter gynuensis TaxID=1302236 RepID=A0ABP8GGC2_9SPHI